MKLRFLSCVLCLTLVSCSLPVARSGGGLAGGEEGPATLLHIRIERWGKSLFSGLLALQKREGELYYILLDATGIKLLEVQVQSSGGFRLMSDKNALSHSKLTPVLSKALARVYLTEPQKLPCSRNWYLRFCLREDEGQGWTKEARVWPFKVWQASGSSSGKNGAMAWTYSQPWLGLRIFLGVSNLTK